MKKLIYTVAFILFLHSCSAKKDLEVITKTESELLTNKKWKLISLSGNISGVSVPGAYSELEEWEKDDYYFFKKNLTYELNANLIKEPGNNRPFVTKGRWQLTNDHVLILTPNGQGEQIDPITIVSISETNMVWEQADTRHVGDLRTLGFTVIP